jgi:hypothetical protein
VFHHGRATPAIFYAATSWLALTSQLCADEPAGAKSRGDIERAETTRLIEAELPQWSISRGASREALKLEAKPVLRWTNPGIGRFYGDVYLWTLEGRPSVVMSLYKAWEPAWGFAAEVQTLSHESISAQRKDELVWNTPAAGVTFAILPSAAEPADSEVRRMQQMRAFAKDFSAQVIDERLTKSGDRQELRLLPQPIYRYQSAAAPEAVDGALFAIVLGTDPEVFLLLEARRAKELLAWHYALARMNKDALVVRYKGDEVWRAKAAGYPGRIEDPYRVMRISESR